MRLKTTASSCSQRDSFSTNCFVLPQHFWSCRVAASRPPGDTFSLLFRQGDSFHRNTFRKNPSGFLLRSYTSPRRWRHSHQGKRRLRRMCRRLFPQLQRNRRPLRLWNVTCLLFQKEHPVGSHLSLLQPPLSSLSPLSSPPFPSPLSFPHTFSEPGAG